MLPTRTNCTTKRFLSLQVPPDGRAVTCQRQRYSRRRVTTFYETGTTLARVRTVQVVQRTLQVLRVRFSSVSLPESSEDSGSAAGALHRRCGGQAYAFSKSHGLALQRVQKTVLAPQAQYAVRAVDIPVRHRHNSPMQDITEAVVDIQAVQQRPSLHSADCTEDRGETSQVQYIDRIVDVHVRIRTPCSRDDATPGSHDPESTEHHDFDTSPVH